MELVGCGRRNGGWTLTDVAAAAHVHGHGTGHTCGTPVVAVALPAAGIGEHRWRGAGIHRHEAGLRVGTGEAAAGNAAADTGAAAEAAADACVGACTCASRSYRGVQTGWRLWRRGWLWRGGGGVASAAIRSRAGHDPWSAVRSAAIGGCTACGQRTAIAIAAGRTVHTRGGGCRRNGG